jgi:hypothetical protein
MRTYVEVFVVTATDECPQQHVQVYLISDDASTNIAGPHIYTDVMCFRVVDTRAKITFWWCRFFRLFVLRRCPSRRGKLRRIGDGNILDMMM